MRNKKIERILLITLSDLLREVSHQDKDQIRVRRAKEIPKNVNVSEKFLERLKENRKKVANTQRIKQHYGLVNNSRALVGDSTESILSKTPIASLILFF